MKKQILLLLMFILSLLGFYLLNHYTDLVIDDFVYKHLITDNPEKAGQRVHTFNDLVESQYNHYFITNGRVLLNGLAQVFLMPENKAWFNIANMVMFGLMQILIFLLIGIKRNEISISFYVLTLAVLWFLVAGPNHTFLWLTGSLNYLWAVVLILAFLYFHNKMLQGKNPVSILWYPIFFLFGFISGATHEVFSIGVSGALFFYYLFNRSKLRNSIIPMIVGFFLGTIFIVLAPGNIVRINSEIVGESTIILTIVQKLWRFASSIFFMRALALLAIVMAILFVTDKKGFKEILNKNIILLLSILFSSLFIILSGAIQARVFFGISVFSIIVLLTIIWKYKYLLKRKWVIGLTYLLAFFMIVEFFFVSRTLHENKTMFDHNEQIWLNSTDKVFMSVEKKSNRFVSYGLGEYDPDFWSNKAMSWYYGKEYMIFLPSDLYNNLFLTSKLIDDKNKIRAKYSCADSLNIPLYISPISRFLISPLNESLSTQIKKGAYINYEPTTSLAIKNLDLRQRLVKFIYGIEPSPITNEKTPCFILEARNGKYLYFKSPEEIPMDKLDCIHIFEKDNQTKAILSLKINCPSE